MDYINFQYADRHLKENDYLVGCGWTYQDMSDFIKN